MEKTLPVTVNAQISPKERESHPKYRCTEASLLGQEKDRKKLFVLSQRLQLYVDTKLEMQILFVNR